MEYLEPKWLRIHFGFAFETSQSLKDSPNLRAGIFVGGDCAPDFMTECQFCVFVLLISGLFARPILKRITGVGEISGGVGIEIEIDRGVLNR